MTKFFDNDGYGVVNVPTDRRVYAVDVIQHPDGSESVQIALEPRPVTPPLVLATTVVERS